MAQVAGADTTPAQAVEGDEKPPNDSVSLRIPEPSGPMDAALENGDGGEDEEVAIPPPRRVIGVDQGAQRDRKVLSAVQALTGWGGSISRTQEEHLVEGSVTVEIKNLTVVTPSNEQSSWKPWGKKEELDDLPLKALLNNVSARVEPGQFLAVMGPEGSGKSLLLRALGGRLKPNKGEVLYNGTPYQSWMRRVIGYVYQAPVLQDNLTVRETLTYAAQLRLPQGTSEIDITVRVEHVLDSLDLQQCANTLVGGDRFKGALALNNEKKRLAIGLEMLMNPMLLLLDEPTSGLDSAMALRLTRTLRAYAGSGRTVVVTMKQPSTRMFDMITHLLLLAEGHPIYFGPASESMNYFRSQGYTPAQAGSPAEYLLDLAVSEPTDSSIHFGTTLKLIRAWRERMLHPTPAAASSTPKDPAGAVLVDSPLRENAALLAHTELDGLVDSSWVHTRWHSSWLFQCQVLLQRNARANNLFSWPILYVAIIVICCSLLTGCLYFKREKATASGIRDQAGLLFYATAFWSVLPLLSTVMTFIKDRKLVVREQESGLYHISAYYVARTLIYSCFEMIPPVLFGAIVYFMADLRNNAGAFFLHLLVLITNSLVSSSVGLALGGVFDQPQQAIWVGSVFMLVALNVVDFLVLTPPPWAEWTRWLSHLTYIYRLLLRVNFPRLNATYDCGGKQCFIEDHPELSHRRNDIPGNGAIEGLVLVFMLIGCRIMAYVILRLRTSPRAKLLGSK